MEDIGVLARGRGHCFEQEPLEGRATYWAHIPTMAPTKGMTTFFLENLQLWQARVIYVCKCMFGNVLTDTKGLVR